MWVDTSRVDTTGEQCEAISRRPSPFAELGQETCDNNFGCAFPPPALCIFSELPSTSAETSAPKCVKVA